MELSKTIFKNTNLITDLAYKINNYKNSINIFNNFLTKLTIYNNLN